ncbi:endonuclease domain-containing protein [Cryptosporangium aurantiacum]|uniref:DUF559 domain-containing protein n=1 Tax=Cryptosporangium aurantiacum TaxID=134849 RepID=A0A1M7GXL9_9ACTN|nr:DUF559 domain-containing protein [Cryptosporangium aurantiacum]SHM20589.1 Protein of unknown function [Cryptosporangium aurantiacum]
MGSDGSWWTSLPRGRVVQLAGVDADALAVSLDPLPADAPVVVTYRPSSTASQAAIVGEVLDLLEDSAVALFPAWLPDAAGLIGPNGANLAAVRVLASRLAGRTSHFGPFLGDLAARALTGGHSKTSFPPEVRATGLTRVLEAAYDRADVVLLVEVRAPLPVRDEHILVASAEWIAHRGGFGGVWLVGSNLAHVDWISVRRVTLPDDVETLVATAPETPADEKPDLPTGLTVPPMAGRPSPQSAAEQLLEKVLASREWAYGRAWNQTVDLGLLVSVVRVDVLWEAERTVVEIDGPEHWQRVHYAADRRRDVLLQTAGYAVLRFTNDQVLGDVNSVVHQIEQFLTARRVP